MRNGLPDRGLARGRAGAGASGGTPRPSVPDEVAGMLEADHHVCVLHAGPGPGDGALMRALVEAVHGCDPVEEAAPSPRGTHVLLCLYDVRRLPGRAIVDVLRAHPRIVAGRRVLDNPYFAPSAVIPERACREAG
jgi:hypothetical protein